MLSSLMRCSDDAMGQVVVDRRSGWCVCVCVLVCKIMSGFSFESML